jgi:hypothetical protein
VVNRLTLPTTDRQRIAVVGHAIGGASALTTMLSDPRIRLDTHLRDRTRDLLDGPAAAFPEVSFWPRFVR